MENYGVASQLVLLMPSWGSAFLGGKDLEASRGVRAEATRLQKISRLTAIPGGFRGNGQTSPTESLSHMVTASKKHASGVMSHASSFFFLLFLLCVLCASVPACA